MIRAARPTDQAYVASTWVQSMLSMERGRPSKTSRAHRLLIDRMLDRPDVKLAIACNPDDQNAIVGWLCFTRMVSADIIAAPRYVCHFCYVRDGFRRRGTMRALMDASGIPLSPLIYTFVGPTTKQMERTMLENAQYITPATFLGAA